MTNGRDGSAIVQSGEQAGSRGHAVTSVNERPPLRIESAAPVESPSKLSAWWHDGIRLKRGTLPALALAGILVLSFMAWQATRPDVTDVVDGAIESELQSGEEAVVDADADSDPRASGSFGAATGQTIDVFSDQVEQDPGLEALRPIVRPDDNDVEDDPVEDPSTTTTVVETTTTTEATTTTVETTTTTTEPADTGPCRFEAEDAALVGVITKGSNGSSGRYTDFQNPVGDSITWTVPRRAAGVASLTFAYALDDDERPLLLTVNRQPVNIGFPPSGSWSSWVTSTVEVSLAAGDNVVRLDAIGLSGGNFDYLEVSACAR